MQKYVEISLQVMLNKPLNEQQKKSRREADLFFYLIKRAAFKQFFLFLLV